MISVRNVLIGLAVAFTAYLAARGLWWTQPVPQPLVVVTALALYLITTWLCIFWEPVPADDAGQPRRVSLRSTAKLPAVAQILALAVAVIVPSAIAFAVGPDARTEQFATWYVGGIGALMTIVLVRGRPWTAWAGIVLMTAAAMIWMGPLAAIELGAVGSALWVGIAQLLTRSIDRAARDTSQLTQLQRAASAWQASQLIRQRERRLRVQEALAVAGPVLTRTVAADGELGDADRLEARLAEGRLRDEMRGPRLLDDDVRAELARARRRGATVTVLDEGGLETDSEPALAVIRRSLAETLRSATSDRIYVRTSPDPRVAVTVVGRSASATGLSDEDSVDLWQEIPHPGAS